jgi:hypothetical protein
MDERWPENDEFYKDKFLGWKFFCLSLSNKYFLIMIE